MRHATASGSCLLYQGLLLARHLRLTRVQCQPRAALRGRRSLQRRRVQLEYPSGNKLVATDCHDAHSADGFYAPGSRPPAPICGPIRLQLLPGKGRGVIVTEDVRPGQLLLVAEPALLLQGPAGKSLEPDDLVKHVITATKPTAAAGYGDQQHLAQLKILANGLPLSGIHLPDLHELVHCGQQHSAEFNDSHPTMPAGSFKIMPEIGHDAAVPMTPSQLRNIIELNCFGEPNSDLAAGTARDELLQSHIGVWPAFAMFNSSCLPNAAGMVLGGRMVVRATRDIAAGDEACITYLGRYVSSPLQERQARLQSSFGFVCTCKRCALEQEHAEGVVMAMQATYTRLMSVLQPAVVAAVAAEDVPAVRRLQRQLLRIAAGVQADLAGIEDSFEYSCLQSGVYKCYELLSMCADALGGCTASTDSMLPVRLRLLSFFAAGSYAHAALAAEHLLHTRRDSGSTGTSGRWQTGRALAWCLTAHVARYGAVSQETLARLVDAHDNNRLLDERLALEVVKGAGRHSRSTAGRGPTRTRR